MKANIQSCPSLFPRQTWPPPRIKFLSFKWLSNPSCPSLRGDYTQLLEWLIHLCRLSWVKGLQESLSAPLQGSCVRECGDVWVNGVGNKTGLDCSKSGRKGAVHLFTQHPAKGQEVCLCVGFQTSTKEGKRTSSALSEKHNVTSSWHQLPPERWQQQPEEMTDLYLPAV